MKKFRKGKSTTSIESEDDTAIVAFEEKFNRLKPNFREIQKAVGNAHKSTAVSIDHQKGVADNLRTLGHELKRLEYNEQSVALGKALLEVGEFQRQVEELRRKLDSAMMSGVGLPVDKWMDNLKEMQNQAKAHAKIKAKYISCIESHTQLREAKKKNQVKIQEAKKNEADAKDAWEKSSAKTAAEFKQLMDGGFERSMESLAKIFVSHFNTFFTSGLELMAALVEEVDTLREYNVQATSVGVDTSRQQAKTVDENSFPKKLSKNFVHDEKEYVAKLGELQEVAITLQSACEKDERLAEIISKDDRHAIFGTLNEIVTAHKKYLKIISTVDKVVTTKFPLENLDAIERLLSEATPRYNLYAANLPFAHATLDANRDNRAFKAFLPKGLKTLLELPMTRLKRYSVILSTLKSDIEDHCKKEEEKGEEPDLSWKIIVERLDTLIARCTAAHKEVIVGVDPDSELAMLMSASHRIKNSPYVIAEAHRRLCFESSITLTAPKVKKSGSTIQVTKEYQCFFFNDKIVYCASSKKSRGKLKTVVGSGKRSEADTWNYSGELALIAGIKFEDVPDTEEEFNVFKLVTPEAQYKFVAPTAKEKAEWKSKLEKALDDLERMKVFGVNVEDVVEKSGGVPMVVKSTVAFLMERGFKTKGIFRESGSQTYIDSLKNQFNMGRAVSFPIHENEHNVSGLLKLWMRDHPDPLLGYDLFDEWISVGETAEKLKKGHTEKLESKVIADMKSCVAKMQPSRRACVRTIMALLHKVSLPENIEENLMESHNLSIVFGPILIKKDGADPYDTSAFSNIYAVVDAMIKYYPSVFDEFEEEEEEEELESVKADKKSGKKKKKKSVDGGTPKKKGKKKGKKTKKKKDKKKDS
eukprot:TRINITY_DN6437_c0_g1_i1.p1 TRINITY_DN6437_c0_g1~~TRINITY_DN6437_c0_g1_i1.p1  ORF type:complete len:870 (+),score=227.52 TRINITY_DN6437_c0_g1_i1:105-2714(+)